MKDNFKQERVNLAAAFRWAARFNMHEAVANHFSLAISDDGSQSVSYTHLTLPPTPYV